MQSAVEAIDRIHTATWDHLSWWRDRVVAISYGKRLGGLNGEARRRLSRRQSEQSADAGNSLCKHVGKLVSNDLVFLEFDLSSY